MLVRHVENVSAYALQKRFREIGKVVLDGKRKGVFNARPAAMGQYLLPGTYTPIIRNF